MKRTISACIALIALIGVIATTIGFAQDSGTTSFATAVYPLKYFTIQSNILVAIYFILSLFPKFEKSVKFRSWFGAVVVYISITFLVFVTMLQAIWHPTGFGLVGSILNHYLTPLSTIAVFVIYRRDYSFSKQNVKSWLIYPIIYMVFLLVHGFVTGDFIYPFFDINTIGIFDFLLIYLLIMTLFFILSFGSIYLTKKKKIES